MRVWGASRAPSGWIGVSDSLCDAFGIDLPCSAAGSGRSAHRFKEPQASGRARPGGTGRARGSSSADGYGCAQCARCYRQLRIDPLPAENAGELLDALLGPDAALAPLKILLAVVGLAAPGVAVLGR